MDPARHQHDHLPAHQGYAVRVYSGVKPAPKMENWVGTFVDGLKLLIIGIIYSIPIFIVMAIFFVPAIMIAGTNGDPMLTLGSIGLGLLIVLGFIITLISTIGIIRFAHKDSMGEAFAFGAILEHIGKIGWGSYIIALIILWIVGIVFGIITTVLEMIPILGWLIMLFLYPVWIIFAARYMTLIYESVPAPA